MRIKLLSIVFLGTALIAAPVLAEEIPLRVEISVFLLGSQPLPVEMDENGVIFLPASQFTVKSKLTNITSAAVDFEVFDCGYGMFQWGSDNELVVHAGASCRRNVPSTIHLGPGESFERSFDMAVQPDAPDAPIRFRLGFKAQKRMAGGNILETESLTAQPIWSNALTVQR